jgi:hypothetical protein
MIQRAVDAFREYCDGLIDCDITIEEFMDMPIKALNFDGYMGKRCSCGTIHTIKQSQNDGNNNCHNCNGKF